MKSVITLALKIYNKDIIFFVCRRNFENNIYTKVLGIVVNLVAISVLLQGAKYLGTWRDL